MGHSDIYRLAKRLIDKYGADASHHATMEADAMLARGDVDGVTRWMRVGRLIREILAAEKRTKH
jgi:hypothetical protein